MPFQLHFRSISSETQAEITNFVQQWENGKTDFEVKTSGSTGVPKTILLSRSQLEQSALRTNSFFQLTDQSSVFCALSPQTIAGKMMLIRAIIGKYSIVFLEPSSNPLLALEPDEQFDFCPLVPFQLSTIIAQTPHLLKRVKTILLGGSPISESIEKLASALHSEIYMGFGMTETVSHIAIRKLGDPEYKAVEGVYFQCSDGQLIISDELLGIKRLRTTDEVKFRSSQSFEWLGRTDFVINSGGIKIHPEHIETVLSEIISVSFFIASRHHKTLGQECVLIVQREESQLNLAEIQQICSEKIGKHSVPRAIIPSEIVYTESNKINRKATLKKCEIV